jgi:hypothetical protein
MEQIDIMGEIKLVCKTLMGIMRKEMQDIKRYFVK